MVFSGMKCIAQILMSFDWHSDSLNLKRVGTTNTLLQNYEFPISHIWWSYNIYFPYEMVVTVINILPSSFCNENASWSCKQPTTLQTEYFWFTEKYEWFEDYKTRGTHTTIQRINVGKCSNDCILLISCLSLHLSVLIHDPEHA